MGGFFAAGGTETGPPSFFLYFSGFFRGNYYIGAPGADSVRSQGAGPYLYDAWLFAAADGKNKPEIKIVGQDNKAMRLRVSHDPGVRRVRGTNT
jgi:hypothetical protein